MMCCNVKFYVSKTCALLFYAAYDKNIFFSENTGIRNKDVIIISQFRADSDLDCTSKIIPLQTSDRM